MRSSWRRVRGGGGRETGAKGGREKARAPEMETQETRAIARARTSSRSKEKANKAG